MLKSRNKIEHKIMNMTPEKQMEILTEFMQPARKERLNWVLEQRTQYLTIILENIYHPQNASAVLRSCECFGIQDLHIISDKKKYRPNADVARGASKWLTLNHYNDGDASTRKCFNTLKERGYKIAITSLDDTETMPLEELPLDNPVALCFGTEDMGVSDEAKELADYKIKIPMFGFTESFNVSVAAAICLYSLTTRLRNSQDLKKKLPLNKELEDTLRLDWHKKCVKNSIKILEFSENRAEEL